MPRDGVAVLGIDAAWTDGEPSGVALVQWRAGSWRCLGVAPSYAGFCDGFEWSERAKRGPFDAAAILKRCSVLADDAPTVVAVDMPVATEQIVGRRAADQEVSRRFGHCKCSTHSPNAVRPGPVGRRLYDALIDRKFRLATGHDSGGPSLLEVYPHPALLGLMQVGERVPYKISKRQTYWPGEPTEARKRLLVERWRAILVELAAHIDGIESPLPAYPEKSAFTALKPYEDALDALVAAWVGIEFIEGRAIALGDATAAIWVPSSSMSFAKPDAA